MTQPDETRSTKIIEFWTWFESTAVSLRNNFQNALILEQLDARIRELDPSLSWEIGPGSNETCQFVISPNLDVSLREKAREIIDHAPVLAGWEFYSARRPKDWNYHVVIKRQEGKDQLALNASDWKFVLLKYPDGIHEVLLQANNLPSLDDDERWQAAAVVLESILGEELLMDRIDEFQLVDQLEPRFEASKRPIRELRDVVRV